MNHKITELQHHLVICSMNTPIFITGIGTDIGKTLVSAIITEALEADYWKPVQAGFADGTDAEKVTSLLSNKISVVHPELYKLALPASPHIAAREEKVEIEVVKLLQHAQELQVQINGKRLLIEGAGGLLVPLHKNLLLVDFIKLLQARVILVSRNYLGSINHSLLTAAFCRSNDINVLGWIFTDSYMSYEDEIVAWSGYDKIASIPKLVNIDEPTILAEAKRIKPMLIKAGC